MRRVIGWVFDGLTSEWITQFVVCGMPDYLLCRMQRSGFFIGIPSVLASRFLYR